MKQTWCNVAAFQILAKPCPFNWRQLFEPSHIYPEAEERYNTIMMMSSFSERAGGIVREKMEPMSLGSPTSSPSSPPSWGGGPPLHSLSLTSPTAPYHQHGAYNSPHQQSYHSGFNTPQQQQHVQHQQLVHSVLTRGALGEVVNLTKPMIESGLGGLDRPCASLITLCSSHLGHFYGQKLPKNGHIWVHRP